MVQDDPPAASNRKAGHLRKLIAQYAMRAGEEFKRGLPTVIREAHESECWKEERKADGNPFTSFLEWLTTPAPAGCGLGSTPDAFTLNEVLTSCRTVAPDVAEALTTVESSAELSPVEAAKLENLEIVIEAGIKSFIDVGRALLQIRDERLYRLTHKTFDDYCRDRWKIDRTYAHRLAEAAATVELLPVGNIQPQNEAQVRPLAKLPVEERAPAWQEAVEASGGKPTAAIVEKIVERRKAPATSKAVEVADSGDELLNDVAAMLNSSVAAMNKSKAVAKPPGKAKASKRNWKEAPLGHCPQNEEQGHKWSDDDCELCGEPMPRTHEERQLCNINAPLISFNEKFTIILGVMAQPDMDLDYYREMQARFRYEIESEVARLLSSAAPEHFHVEDDSRRVAAQHAIALIGVALDRFNKEVAHG